jgi:hypothetical protein
LRQRTPLAERRNSRGVFANERFRQAHHVDDRNTFHNP